MGGMVGVRAIAIRWIEMGTKNIQEDHIEGIKSPYKFRKHEFVVILIYSIFSNNAQQLRYSKEVKWLG